MSLTKEFIYDYNLNTESFQEWLHAMQKNEGDVESPYIRISMI